VVAKVLWRDAQGIEGAIELGAGEIRIGRAMDCAIRTDDAMVSRHHARLLWGGGGYVLEDLQSANGVYYQEQKVQSHMLKHGDAVRCGSLWLRYVDTAQLGGPEPGSQQPAQPPVPVSQQPMMQHPGLGATAAHSPTNQAMNAVSQQQLAGLGVQPLSSPPVSAPPPPGPDAAAAAAKVGEADEEIRRLRRRLEQLQAELRRLQGQLLQAEGADPADIDTALRSALTIARSQSARALELRAALALARHLSAVGRSDEAHALVLSVYAAFGEDQQSTDLTAARELLNPTPAPPA